MSDKQQDNENAYVGRLLAERNAAREEAKAYQQVYFEDERRWQNERAARIKAESENVRLRVTVDNTGNALAATVFEHKNLLNDVVALRAALRALVDATTPITAITYSLMSIHDTSWEEFAAARATAVALLAGPTQ